MASMNYFSIQNEFGRLNELMASMNDSDFNQKIIF